MRIDFKILNRTEKIVAPGQPCIIFNLVARISTPTIRNFTYPMTVRYIDGMVTHDKEKLARELPAGPLRSALIVSMKSFVKSQVE